MSSLIVNQFTCDSFTDILKNSSKYMLTNVYMENISKMNPNLKNESIKSKQTKPKFNKNDFYYLYEKDSLFWCFYVIANGFDDYTMISNKFITEKETKIKYIEELRQNKYIFKEYKLSRPTIEGELSSDKQISMKSICALCYLKKINILYIDNKKYYEVFPYENNNYYVIQKQENKYGFKTIDEEQLKYYQDHYWKMENLDKPIKAVSSYKTSELKEICEKLGLKTTNENNKSMTKDNLYRAIIERLMV